MRLPFSQFSEFLRRRRADALWLKASPPVHSPAGALTVVGLLAGDANRHDLTGICGRNQWRLLFADNPCAAKKAVNELRAPVMLCDRDLVGDEWRTTLTDLAASPHRACVILVSAVVDSYLWYEVVRFGGFDVLSKPLREDEVVRTLRLAWSYWETGRSGVGIARPGDRVSE